MAKRSFLIVDNSPAASKQLAEILTGLGYRDIEQVGSASEAWEMLKLRQYAGVIAEMEMPDMSGLVLLKIVRGDERLFNLPFILSHDAFTKVKVLMAGKEGVSDLFVKPFNPDRIREKLRGALDISEEPVVAETRHSLEEGLGFLENDEPEKALAVFEKLVVEGESAEIYYNIGYIKTAQEKFDEALAAFRKATELDRLFAKAYEAMGRIYHKLGRPEDAERFLQKAADIHLSKENMADAEEILNQILEIRPDTINVYNSLGVLHRKKGNFEEALKSYQKALRIHPNQPQIHYNMGRLWLELKDTGKAREQFEKAMVLNPQFKEARDVLEAIRLGAIV
jgi:tetratricopeptide (TPR) repeat protein